ISILAVYRVRFLAALRALPTAWLASGGVPRRVEWNVVFESEKRVARDVKRKEVLDPYGLLRTLSHQIAAGLQPALRRLPCDRRDRRVHAPLLVADPFAQGDRLRPARNDPLAARPDRDQPAHPLAAPAAAHCVQARFAAVARIFSSCSWSSFVRSRSAPASSRRSCRSRRRRSSSVVVSSSIPPAAARASSSARSATSSSSGVSPSSSRCARARRCSLE